MKERSCAAQFRDLLQGAMGLKVTDFCTCVHSFCSASHILKIIPHSYLEVKPGYRIEPFEPLIGQSNKSNAFDWLKSNLAEINQV